MKRHHVTFNKNLGGWGQTRSISRKEHFCRGAVCAKALWSVCVHCLRGGAESSVAGALCLGGGVAEVGSEVARAFCVSALGLQVSAGRT